MSKNDVNLQDVFLNQARLDKIPLTVIMINGYQLRGVVSGFDSFTVILDCEGKQNLVYKHGISTIVPQRNVVFNALEK